MCDVRITGVLALLLSCRQAPPPEMPHLNYQQSATVGSVILNQDSAWLWLHRGVYQAVRDTVIFLGTRKQADSIGNLFSTRYQIGSKGDLVIQTEAWNTAVPIEVRQAASFKGEIKLVPIADSSTAFSTYPQFNTMAISLNGTARIYLDSYASMRVLSNPRIEIMADIGGDAIVVNGREVTRTANTVVVAPGTQLVRLVDVDTRDTLQRWSVTLSVGQYSCHYWHRRQRRLDRCPGS